MILLSVMKKLKNRNLLRKPSHRNWLIPRFMCKTKLSRSTILNITKWLKNKRDTLPEYRNMNTYMNDLQTGRSLDSLKQPVSRKNRTHLISHNIVCFHGPRITTKKTWSGFSVISNEVRMENAMFQKTSIYWHWCQLLCFREISK